MSDSKKSISKRSNSKKTGSNKPIIKKLDPEEFKGAVGRFADSLRSTEISILERKKNTDIAEIISYSRMEIGGDSINFINKNSSKDILEFHKEILMTSLRGRRAFWKFVTNALK